MKKSFSKALVIFKYIFIVFSLIYWVGVIIDDWVFIEKYWKTNWLQYLGIWMAYFITFSITFSLYYWGIATVFILIYHKIIQPINRKTDDHK